MSRNVVGSPSMLEVPRGHAARLESCRRRLAGIVAIVSASLWTLSPLVASGQVGGAPAASPAAASRPSAICSPGDQPETGLQGETPLRDIESGRNRQPYTCGAKLVSFTPLEGGIMRRSRTCVYVSNATAARGIRVIDMKNPKAPRLLGALEDPGAIASSESFNVVDTPDRHVLVAAQYSSALTSLKSPMSIYDISDCESPRLMSTFEWPGDTHVPSITPDGKTVFVSLPYGVAGLMAVDISDLAKPRYLGQIPLLLPGGRQARCHDLSFNADGTRLYCPGSIPMESVREADPGPTVWDISDITYRRTIGWPPAKFIGEADVKGQGDHDAPVVHIHGKPYLVAGSELGCGIGKSDFPTIFDISDEKNPRRIGEFRLEVMERCVADSTFKANQKASYGLHYNNAVEDAFGSVPLGMFSFRASGVRFVDLRDPTQPREVAYFRPGAPPPVPAAEGRPARERYADNCTSHNYFDQATGYFWILCGSGIYVVELNPSVKSYLGVNTPRNTGR